MAAGNPRTPEGKAQETWRSLGTGAEPELGFIRATQPEESHHEYNESSLRDAFAGAHGAYCVTNFWEHFSPEREIAQAGNMARAAKSAGLGHVIWSTCA